LHLLGGVSIINSLRFVSDLLSNVHQAK
jgi:hypothetical protein